MSSIFIKPLLYCCLHEQLIDFTNWAEHATHHSELFLFPLSIGKNYHFVQCLSSRGQKKCFKMKEHFGGKNAKTFAVTSLSISPEESQDKKDLCNLLIEGRSLQIQVSPYLLKFQDVFFDQSFNALITLTEFFDVNLEDQLSKLSQNECLQIFINVCEGVLDLHMKNYMHSNICLRSVVIGKNKKPKIVGLINAQKLNSPNYNTIYEYTYKPIWPPEFIQGKLLNEKFDVWCLGILLHQMLADKKMPFIQHKTNKELHKMLREFWNDEAKAEAFIKIDSSVRLIKESISEMIKSNILNR